MACAEPLMPHIQRRRPGRLLQAGCCETGTAALCVAGMETVEPVFGQIKQARGFRLFLLRGLEKVNREWLLICTGHNLLKLFRSAHRATA